MKPLDDHDTGALEARLYRNEVERRIWNMNVSEQVRVALLFIAKEQTENPDLYVPYETIGQMARCKLPHQLLKKYRRRLHDAGLKLVTERSSGHRLDLAE